MWLDILEQVLIAIITAAITAAAGYLVKYLSAKKAEDKENKLVQAGCDLIADVVNATTQTVVKDLKAGNLFTKEKAVEVKDNVLNTLKTELSAEQISAIQKKYNLSIEDFLSTKIESVIANNKK